MSKQVNIFLLNVLPNHINYHKLTSSTSMKGRIKIKRRSTHQANHSLLKPITEAPATKPPTAPFTKSLFIL